MNELFPSDFLAAIERLTLDLGRSAASPVGGAHLSRAPGLSLDFRDYRGYTPGDDLRRVDWNVYQRSGHLFVRTFEHPTTAPVYILLDNSPSMFVESPARFTAAARVAAAVAVASLKAHDPLTIELGSGPTTVRKLTGARALPAVLELLVAASSSPGRTLSEVIEAFSRGANRQGVAVVISDFFDPVGIDTLLSSLTMLPHRLLLIQVTQPWDASPSLQGELELVDCETGRVTDVSVSPALLASYLKAYRGFENTLAAFLQRRGCGLHKIDASAEILSQIGQMFPGGVLNLDGAVR